MFKRNHAGYSTQYDVVALSSKRFQFSPYRDRYPEEITYGLYSNRFYPLAVKDEDFLKDYWSLRESAMLYDVPEKPMEFVGPDALKLLEKLFARKISNLQPLRARYALACNHSGNVIMDGVLIRLSEDRFWYVKASGEFDSWVEANLRGFDVTYRDPASWVLQIQGPNSLEVLRRASDTGLPDEFGYFSADWVSLADQRVLVSRTGWTGEKGFEVYSQSDTDHLKLWDHLMASGDPLGLRFASVGSMGIRRMEAGIFDNDVDLAPQSISPFGAGLGAFVDLEKPDFIGRDALMMASHSLELCGVVSDTNSLYAGVELRDSDRVVAKIVSGGWSPTLEKGIGYARFSAFLDRDKSWLGHRLIYADKEGCHRQCLVTELPFFDKEKRLPR